MGSDFLVRVGTYTHNIFGDTIIRYYSAKKFFGILCKAYRSRHLRSPVRYEGNESLISPTTSRIDLRRAIMKISTVYILKNCYMTQINVKYPSDFYEMQISVVSELGRPECFLRYSMLQVLSQAL